MKLPVDYNKLTWQERKLVREKYIQLQKGKCHFCEEDLSKEVPKKILSKKIDWSYFPDNFLKYPIHLQHNHETGLTEGSVHSYCNAVMWQHHNL
jgi:hypothetical protein